MSHHLIKTVLCAAFLLAASVLRGQENSGARQLLAQAEANYTIGRLEQARQQLSDNLLLFKGTLRESAFRLLALCALGLDEEQKAEEYAHQLLSLNPYYSTTSSDPQRFADMVSTLKAGLSATITTASNQAENLSEVPVPTTLITEEMISDCGARNLQEVLAAYVPGMNIVDCNNDINIAMRGIYSNGQEKILIMLNGHRLNSYCTNIASPNFSIGLEKLKQIEVLRGPASSLYGGVALTAVVNLITKQGADVEGVEWRARAGSHGQAGIDAMFGKRYYDLDVLLWGTFYKAKGEKVKMENTNALSKDNLDYVTVGGIGNLPSYEFGITMEWKDLRIMYNSQFSQVMSPLTISTMGQPYRYDKYRTYNGLRPGFATQAHHARLSYAHKIGGLNIEQTLSYDNNNLTHYQVLSEDTVAWLGDLLNLPDELAQIFENNGGTSRYINGQENTYGWHMRGDYSYMNTKSHKGSVTFGADYNYFELNDVRYTIGYNYEYGTMESPMLHDVGKGHEMNYNGFVQLKHHWRSFIFNAGLRYDHKDCYDDYRMDEFSPRLALILTRPKWNVKYSFSKAFVDAPYLYQKINQFLYVMNLTEGNNNAYTRLHSEQMYSQQLTFAGTEWIKGLNMELNMFYNSGSDFICSNLLAYDNSGKNKTIGAEFLGNYRTSNFTANLSMAWLKTLKSNLLISDVDHNNCTPTFTANTVLTWKPVRRLKLSTHIAFESRQTSYNVSLSTLMNMKFLSEKIDILKQETEQGMDKYDALSKFFEELSHLNTDNALTGHDIAARCIVDAGATYQLTKNLWVGVNANNLFNTRYYRSGMDTGLVPQRSRWILFSLGCKL